GQGALAVQVRRADLTLMELVSAIDDEDVRLAVEAEREVLRATGGTCRAPVGAHATVSGDELWLLAGGVNSDGSAKLVERLRGKRGEAMELATKLGRRLLAEVALRRSRSSSRGRMVSPTLSCTRCGGVVIACTPHRWCRQSRWSSTQLRSPSATGSC